MLSAAFDFHRAHAQVQNRASGALEQEATITYSEVLEHSFYQMLNIAHIVFLHGVCRLDGTLARAAAVRTRRSSSSIRSGRRKRRRSRRRRGAFNRRSEVNVVLK